MYPKKMWTLMFTKMRADLCIMQNMVIEVAYLSYGLTIC